jgi:SNF2 family DNA or RNA helicase
MFKVPLTWANCLALRTELGDDLALDPSLAAWGRTYRKQAKPLIDLRDRHDRMTISPNLPGFDTLFAHQRSGVDLIMQSQTLHTVLGDGMGARYLVLDETGVGKTRVALGAIAQLDAAPVVILCPKSVIRTWHDEAKVFFPNADIREVHGTAVQRRKMLTPGGFLYIMSYESLRAHSRILGYAAAPALTDEQRQPKEIQALGAQMLVVDEVHRCASPRTLQTRAAWAVADEVEHVIAMTGTPIQESPEDLWAVLRMLDRKTFPGVTAFRDRYLDMVVNPFGGWDVKGLLPSTRHEFLDLFHTMSRRAEKHDVLPYLPPKVYEIRWVDLPADNRKAYRQMEKQYLLEVDSGRITAASNPMVAAGRLIQLANSTLDVLPGANPDDEDIVRMVDPSPKVKQFMADIDAGDFDSMSVVVYSASKQLLNLCARAFDEHRPAIPYTMITGDTDTADRNEAIRAFQAGEVRYILISTAGDTGITLTAASVMVRLTRSWSYVKHTQAEDRVHRIGSEQHESILYIDYLTEDTLEEGQVTRLNSKREKATEVLHPDELRQMMTRGPK